MLLFANINELMQFIQILTCGFTDKS